MNPIVKKLIEANIEYIENNRFDIVYQRALDVSTRLDIGEITDIFYDSGINPLEHLTFVPSLYLDNSKLKTITIPNNIEVLRTSAFAYSNLEFVTLHDMCELSESSFSRCPALKSIIIPKIMNEVPEECFYGCVNLETVDLGEVEQVATCAFDRCTNLKSVIVPDSLEWIASDAFQDVHPDITFFIKGQNEYAINYANDYGFKVKLI